MPTASGVPTAWPFRCEVAAAPWNSAPARSEYVLAGLLLLGYAWRRQQERRTRALRYGRPLKQTVRERTSELDERNQQLQLSVLRGRVLVVEDRPLNREGSDQHASARSGCRWRPPVMAGEEALEQAPGRHFDAILMDCGPARDGRLHGDDEAACASQTGPRVPIIALRADASMGGRDACLTAGMDDYRPSRSVARPCTLCSRAGSTSTRERTRSCSPLALKECGFAIADDFGTGQPAVSRASRRHAALEPTMGRKSFRYALYCVLVVAAVWQGRRSGCCGRYIRAMEYSRRSIQCRLSWSRRRRCSLAAGNSANARATTSPLGS